MTRIRCRSARGTGCGEGGLLSAITVTRIFVGNARYGFVRADRDCAQRFLVRASRCPEHFAVAVVAFVATELIWRSQASASAELWVAVVNDRSSTWE
jgi:hypothetical protein